jgi:N-acetylated-alpha-linked acidic dipeptidase
MRRFATQASQSISEKHWVVSVDSLTRAIGKLEDAAIAFGSARDRALSGMPSLATLRRVNAAQLQVERQLTRPQGLVTRSWFRNLIYASDENNGYATMVFPSVGEAIRAGDPAIVAREVNDLAARFDAATREMQRATESFRAM